MSTSVSLAAFSRGVILPLLLLAGCRSAAARRALRPADAEVAPVASLGGATPAGFIAPNPLLSVGRPIVGWSPLRFAKIANLTDGDPRTAWDAGRPLPHHPAWVAVDIGSGPARVLVSWSAGGSFNYEETDYGSPGAYRIETSTDSSDGADGTWRTVIEVLRVTTHSQAHSFDFSGQRWVKLVVTAAPAQSPNGVQIDEFEVRDASHGVSDAWFFMGDSITAFAFGRTPAGERSFAAIVHGRHPRHFPELVGGGVGGEKSDEALLHVDNWLQLNPDARFWCVAYGTNDAAGDAADTRRFRANLESILDRAEHAGRVAILATIPFASDDHHRNIQRFNSVIDELQRMRSLPRGPDLYAWFLAHPEELRDGVHPNDRGIGSINRLWAEAVDVLYAP
jgi:hypothetical protein